jgi:hypothetical protein
MLNKNQIKLFYLMNFQNFNKDFIVEITPNIFSSKIMMEGQLLDKLLKNSDTFQIKKKFFNLYF